jgi:hypothetical protein
MRRTRVAGDQTTPTLSGGGKERRQLSYALLTQNRYPARFEDGGFR